MVMDKDDKIITQVGAKIACDMVDKTLDTANKLAEFAILFEGVVGLLLEKTGGGAQLASVATFPQTDAQIAQSFNATTPASSPSTGSLQIIGEQHGEIPAWLFTATKRDGVTKVYDNRSTATATNKRPLFKAVEQDKAYWAPRVKSF